MMAKCVSGVFSLALGGQKSARFVELALHQRIRESESNIHIFGFDYAHLK
jgi:hypothetical protein